jgi:hypothetical protein
MKTLILTAYYFVAALLGVAALGTGTPGAAPSRANAGMGDWTDKAVSADLAVAEDAQHRLRDAGPQGLQALEKRFGKEIQLHRSGAPSDAQWKKIALALDHVGGQYDNYASGLYWYTDMEKAEAAARASGKPILSLRLLGRLDEDLSCANSRFFRTTLYPSAEINQLLKQRFILHWQSVRPAPKVTIEFGDGRKLQRTITGNSIHYILDANGRVVDALPGLYTAPEFVAELRQAADAAQQALNSGDHDYRGHFQATRSRLLEAWASDLKALQINPPAAQPLTEAAFEGLMTDSLWQDVARFHAAPVNPDRMVRELMARKLTGGAAPFPGTAMSAAQTGSSGPPPRAAFPNAKVAARAAVAKSAVEVRMLNAFDVFDEAAALDTVKNNYMLRTKILTFLAAPGARSWTLDQINDWVYARIFLTPRQDPWLGLATPSVFSAIDGNGEVQ